MAVRKKLRHDQRTRDQIQTTQLLKRLTKHALGEIELTSSQVNSIKILLGKTLPDLQSLTIDASVETYTANELSDAELTSIATAGSAGTSTQKKSASKPDSVH